MLNLTRNFVLSLLKLRVINPKLRVFIPKLQNFIPKFRDFYPKLRVFKPTYRNFGCKFRDFLLPKLQKCQKHEVSNEVSVERKPEKFSKAKMNYCVGNRAKSLFCSVLFNEFLQRTKLMALLFSDFVFKR
jgi:hypothetical protein